MSGAPQKTLGLVLSAGGARAAYQVGVLKYMAEHFPNFDPKVFTGISAGSINAAYLAQGIPMKEATAQLYELWAALKFEGVFNTNFSSMLRMGMRWIYDLFLSKITDRLLLKSILDASPLSQTLLVHMQFWKVSRAIRSGVVQGLAISATNYLNGTTTTFYDSADPLEPWVRERRTAIRCAIRVRHIMASCSIPILFEPVPIGTALYGDGSLRFNYPFSPAIHLGSQKLISIGIRCPRPATEPSAHLKNEHLGIGYVAGSVLNSIFLDAIDFDYENLQRINRIVGENSDRNLPVLLLRPSKDLGKLATEFINEVPFNLRQLINATAKREEIGDLLSYLMFSPGYLKALLTLGYEDAKLQHSVIEKFLSV